MESVQRKLDSILADKDANLLPENLKAGVTCLGVEGTYTGEHDILYTELEYIESTGTQYIDTGINAENNMTMYARIMPLEDPTESYHLWLSSVRTASHHFTFFESGNKKDIIHGYGTDWYVSDSDMLKINELLEITSTLNNGSQVVTINGNEILNHNVTGDYNLNKNLYIFARNHYADGVIYSSSYRLYELKLYKNSGLIRDFIPVLDESGVPCLYDKITKKFFYNQGTGTFKAGDGQEVNYTMLYDGSLGDATLNQCSDVTGGWIGGPVWDDYLSGGIFELSDTSMHYGENNSSYASRYAVTKSKVNLDQCVGLFIKAKDNTGSGKVTTMARIVESSDTFIPGTSATYYQTPGTEIQIVTYESSVSNKQRLTYLDISNANKSEDGNYVMLYSHSGGGASRYMHIYCYEVVVVKQDDWQTLAEKARITATSIDDILTNSTTLLSNEKAVEFMLKKCTGNFMASAIQNETFLTALDNSPYKTKIYANAHWSKFLTMVA